MKGDYDEYEANEYMGRYYRKEITSQKMNTLLSDLIEKEKEIVMYKNRLKDLETAFYYNLELISERDMELNVLEKKLKGENEQLQQVIHERDELEDIIKAVDNKKSRKIQQLENKLTVKEEEVKKLRRENLESGAEIKRIVEDLKEQHEKKVYKITSKFEIYKSELLKDFREELHEKDNYYLLEIDNLTEKLEEASREKDKFLQTEEENKCLRYHLRDVERLFQEKENQYLEEIRKKSKINRKCNQGVQCQIQVHVVDRKVQVEPETIETGSQTSEIISEPQDCYEEKIRLLQEQNEILKCVIKDLKKNREQQSNIEDFQFAEGPYCLDCSSVKIEVKEIHKKFGNEIENLKKVLQDEQNQRAEEEAVLQSLEASVNCLKDKLLMNLQEKLEDYAGDDICSYTYNREIQNEIQVTLLERKLSKKIDDMMTRAEEERRKVNEKLEDLKKECLEKMEKYVKPREEPFEIKNENLLERIRMEIHKLENKIESDMKNIVRNNSERNKCDKNFQAKQELSDVREITTSGSPFANFIRVEPQIRYPNGVITQGELKPSGDSRFYYKNDISPEKCISVLKIGREPVKYQNGLRKKKIGEQRTFRKLTNDLIMSR